MTIRAKVTLFGMGFATLAAFPSCSGTSDPDPVFTQRIAFYGSCCVTLPVGVTVDGTQIGNITGYWPLGPGNCSADFTARMEVHDTKTHDWNARTPDGFAFSGTFAATPGTANGCTIVQVF
jgi:hypothetical protein